MSADKLNALIAARKQAKPTTTAPVVEPSATTKKWKRDRKLDISVFDSTTDLGDVEHKANTWDGLCDYLANRPPSAANKQRLQLFKLAKFGDTRNPNGKHSLRWNGNVLHLSGIVADYDAGEVPVDEAAKQLEAAGIASFLYTSPSHMQEGKGHRWRVLTPLAEDAAPDEHNKLVDKLNGALGGILAPESWVLTQPMYFGRLDGSQYETRRVKGFPLDLVDGITPIGKRGGALAETRVEKPEPRERVEGERAVPAGYVETINRTDPDCDYDTWRDIGMRLHDYTQGGDAGFNVWNEWSAKGTKYPGQHELRAKWDTFGHGAGPQATLEGLGAVATVADLPPPLDQNVFDQAMQELHAERVTRVKWMQLGDHKRRPPPEWLIKRIIPRKPLGAIYGPSGSGKSFTLLDMGLAIARGVLWREFKTRQGGVGWLAAEAVGSMRNRSLAYEKGHGVNVDELPFYVLGEGIDLTNRDTVRVIADSAPKGLVLIIVDTLAAASASANENSGEDMNPVLDNCALIHEITGAAVLLIHHTGKDEARGMRGWSGIRARLDYEGEVRARDDKSGLRDLRMTKQRDGEEGQAMPVKLVQVGIGMDEDDEIITSAYVEHVDEKAVATERATLKKSQGKWHRAIRESLVEAKDMRLQREPLYVAMLARVPEGERTAHPDARFREALTQMVQLGELKLASDEHYEFTAAGAPRNPDAVDSDADLL